MSRHRRHLVIADLLRDTPVSNQHELRDALAQQGMEVTQATLSRDLRAMGVVKTASGYRASADEHAGRSGSQASATLRTDLIVDFVLSITVAGQMVVLKTGPGRAQAVAYEIDLHPPKDAVGTVAGDDTIFICTSGPVQASRLAKQLAKLLGIQLAGSNATRPTPGGGP